jgi:hypothetical protein
MVFHGLVGSKSTLHMLPEMLPEARVPSPFHLKSHLPFQWPTIAVDHCGCRCFIHYLWPATRAHRLAQDITGPFCLNITTESQGIAVCPCLPPFAVRKLFQTQQKEHKRTLVE